MTAGSDQRPVDGRSYLNGGPCAECGRTPADVEAARLAAEPALAADPLEVDARSLPPLGQVLPRLSPAWAGGPIDEYGQLYAGGSVLVWDLAEELTKTFLLADRINAGQRAGGKVLRRRVIVVEEWAEVARG